MPNELNEPNKPNKPGKQNRASEANNALDSNETNEPNVLSEPNNEKQNNHAHACETDDFDGLYKIRENYGNMNIKVKFYFIVILFRNYCEWKILNAFLLCQLGHFNCCQKFYL
ncbi:hypothetical protein AK88_00946 [Plasmodium fragile]|uniref:Uncharacterized protein n=1 Tax=Plasmodium fragile TaxID=5857 RepID=A0A0D9QTU9_PLAFR|nr:uncharacterized protein AK88_00946 [Plasmodium fragile]KJP89286.1 hypothetical protein AK88_00946 [Plasmodium fragile]